MPDATTARDDAGSVVVESRDLQRLLDVLAAEGYEVIGPSVRSGAIAYERIEKVDELPVGLTDEQTAGSYRLRPREDAALFGYSSGPHSWKRLLHPPRQRLFRAEREGEALRFHGDESPTPRYALLGVRACELHAIASQDEVLARGQHADPEYRARRDRCLIIAARCGKAGGTCFCASMGTGPEPAPGYDLAFTEMVGQDRHYFLFDCGSEQGAKILAELPQRPAKDEERAAARMLTESVADAMGRTLQREGLPELLRNSLEHPHWQDVGQRCLSCANCTMVCPTCFCTTVEDTTSLEGETAERWQRWDSCFAMDFSYVHGGSVRASAMARYRQWMTHKLSSWHEQFEAPGCVGCGRCITWCPVGIDITQEARALRARSATSERSAQPEE